MQLINCNLKYCLQNNGNGYCDNFLPNIIALIRPNTINCQFYDCDRQKSIQDLKMHGGMLGAINRINGKKTEKELLEIKKSKRKPREDKGKKRKKDENILKDIL